MNNSNTLKATGSQNAETGTQYIIDGKLVNCSMKQAPLLAQQIANEKQSRVFFSRCGGKARNYRQQSAYPKN